jgi:hypothetical protein
VLDDAGRGPPGPRAHRRAREHGPTRRPGDRPRVHDPSRIPAANLIALPLGRTETLEWKDYATRVLGPLRSRLLAAGLLEGKLEESADARTSGFIPTGDARLRWLVLVHGVPLKVAPSGIKGLNPANR